MKPLVVLSGALLILGGCKVFGGSGDSESEANAVARKYNRPAQEVWDAVTNALQTLDLRIEEDRHDALGGQLTGRRATGDEVNILVKSIDEQTSQVSVSVEDGNRNMADIVHSQIARNLGTGTAKTSFYGGNRLEQTYDTSLARAIMAGERACDALGFVVSNRELRENSADLMARRSGSATLLLHFESVQPQANPPANGARGVPSDKAGQVKVSFIAGTMRSDDNEELLQRMKTEFDRLVK